MHYCFLTFGDWDKQASTPRLRELGGELFRRGHKVTFILDDGEVNRSMKVPVGIATSFIPSGGSIKQAFARRRAVRDLNPTFLHILNPSREAFRAAAGLWGQRVIGDWDEWPARQPGGFFQSKRAKFVDRWLRKRSTVRFVASRYLQKEFDQLGTPAIYLPYAANLPTLPPVESPYRGRTFVYYGNLYPAYDHDLLFDAVELLRQAGLYPNVEIIGSGPETERWAEFISRRQLTNVTLRGSVSAPELAVRLRHAHVLLLPIRDSLANRCRAPSKLFNYAQAARPILTNRVGEVHAVLADKATYVESTPKAFADAMAKMMKQALPDVDYGIERHNWGERATTLLVALETRV